MSYRIHSILLLILLFVASGVRAPAQGNAACSMPALGGILNEPNILSEQQEDWLGEILAPQIEKQFKIVPDANGYLQMLADRLLAQLPQSNIRYSFTIVDLPDNNSFGIPGGHIYVSRRIIALAQNEDELAGLLGHEIGHIITRQPAIELTRMFQTVLGVSQLGDRKDVRDKWNRLLDTWATKPDRQSRKQEERREEEEQLIADRIALYAMTRAGYQPARFVDFFDRLAQTKGNKGSFWTDLFGRTSHDARRLRELVRTSAPLIQSCLAGSPDASGPERFIAWQKAVIASDFAAVTESVPGLIAKKSLNPPLRSDLRVLRFSPDGKYLAAQDETSIFVLSTNPVSNLFRIDAPDTYSLHFTPDSHAIVFYDKELRVQKWDIQGKRLWVRELALAARCYRATLSHSGDVLACLDDQLQPQLIDVNSSTVIYKGNKLHERPKNSILAYLPGNSIADLLEMRFSPDDHYFLAAHENVAFAYDLKTRSVIELPRKAKDLVSVSFAFLSADEIAGYSFQKGRPGIARASFPSGEIKDSISGNYGGTLAAPDSGNYMLVLRSGDPAVVVLDWRTRQTTLMYKKPAFAVYGDVFAGETAGGEIGVYGMIDKKYQGGIDLPNDPLFSTTASLFSSDGNWLAISQQTRGAVWNLATGERVFLTRGFQGAFFDQDQFFAKFPKHEKEAAAVFKMDTKSKAMQNLYDLPHEAQFLANSETALYWQQGDLLLKGTRPDEKKPGEKKDDRYFLIEALDVRTNKKLWERKSRNDLPYAYHSYTGHTVTVVIANYADMKLESAKDPALSAKLDGLVDEKRRKASYILEVLEDSTGQEKGKLLVDTGNLSFKIAWAVTIGDLVLVTDSSERTLIYSLRTGEQKASIFGYTRAISSDAKTMLVEDRNGKADLYDLATLAPRTHFDFPYPVVHAQFLADGKTLMVLTTDQTIYRLNVDVAPKTASAN